MLFWRTIVIARAKVIVMRIRKVNHIMGKNILLSELHNSR